MQPILASAMREMFLLTSLALLSCVPLTGSSTDIEYVLSNQSNCLEIPEDLHLCHGINYTQTMLPNLLEHESMTEVKQQASVWVPLVHMKCHPNTQIFLCSLFTPVCLDQLVGPCQLFCESVRDACSPVMESFGYVWPEMLDCSRFSREDKDACITMTTNQTVTPVESDRTGHKSACPPCDIKMNADDILENMCVSHFAIRAQIKTTKIDQKDKKVVLRRKKKVVWKGSLKTLKLKKLELHLKNGAHCPCQQLDNTTEYYLLMGREMGKLYLLTGIHHWDEENEEFKKFLNRPNTHKCPFN